MAIVGREVLGYQVEADFFQDSASRERVQLQGWVHALIPEGKDLVTAEHTFRCMFSRD